MCVCVCEREIEREREEELQTKIDKKETNRGREGESERGSRRD